MIHALIYVITFFSANSLIMIVMMMIIIVIILGDLQTVEKDIATIVESCTETGLRLNTTKCEIVMEDFRKIDGVDAFKDFFRVNKEEMILLGAPVVRGIAQDTAIKNKIDDLTRTTERLQLLHSSTCSR